MKEMTVHELIKILSKEVRMCDRKTSKIEIWHDNQEYGIESMSRFELSPDVVINIKPIETPVMKPATFKKEHKKMMAKKVKQIQKSISSKE